MINLTDHQKESYQNLQSFLLTPNKKVHILEGYSGTGKTTLIREILDNFPKLLDLIKVLELNIDLKSIYITATTNKAVEVLEDKLPKGFSNLSTIYSLLGLRVTKDIKTGKTHLRKTRDLKIYNSLVIIDEASYLDTYSINLIMEQIDVNSKVIFVGDPAQLTVKSNHAPIFSLPYEKTKLTEVIRQAKDNPIIDVSTKFRQAVYTNRFFSFKPDKKHIYHIKENDWNNLLKSEFSKPDWQSNTSKILTYTNQRAIQYNTYINHELKGKGFSEGDYAVNNEFIKLPEGSIKTDQILKIKQLNSTINKIDNTEGFLIKFNEGHTAFLPKNPSDKQLLLKKFRKSGEYRIVEIIESNWIDLRHLYAQTVHKSQGSTYDKVFIDLNDVKKCHNGRTIARLLYVAVSRAKYKVYFTGDLV